MEDPQQYLEVTAPRRREERVDHGALLPPDPGRPFARPHLPAGAAGETDEVWAAAAEHFGEAAELGAITLEIAVTNFFNRINRAVREQAGKTW